MKSPGLGTVHVVDSSGHCVPGIARTWNDNGTIDFTVFTVPGAITAMRGISLHEHHTGEDKTPLTWHWECKIEDE